MHHYIPSNPFKATVKIHSAGSTAGSDSMTHLSEGQAEFYR